MHEDPYSWITDTQKRFVVERGATLDGRGWVSDYLDNLFTPLHPDTVRDFEETGELTATTAGRIAAPHSSTALNINMFDVWRGADLDPVSRAFGVNVDTERGYEVSHSLGLGRPAQPDVEFAMPDGRRFAVEVKLREPYDLNRYSNEFADRYFETPGLWTGLPNLETFAEGVRAGKIKHTTLHSAQLVKHALGLHRSYGSGFVLGYLWYSVPSKLGERHAEELDAFAAVALLDINFVSWQVGDLIGRFTSDGCPPAWKRYMTDRYSTRTRGTMD